MENKYPNFELDVIYKNGTFYIAHDISDINEEILDNYFFYLSGNDSKVWLDIKNITADNAAKLFDDLNCLAEQYNIYEERIIIESRNWQAFKLIKDTNYKKSFYIDMDPESDIESKMKKIKEINKAYNSGYIDAISFLGENYRFISENITYAISFLTWEHRLYEWQLPFIRYVRDIIKDPRVDVILCKQKGNYHL